MARKRGAEYFRDLLRRGNTHDGSFEPPQYGTYNPREEEPDVKRELYKLEIKHRGKKVTDVGYDNSAEQLNQRFLPFKKLVHCITKFTISKDASNDLLNWFYRHHKQINLDPRRLINKATAA